MWHPLRNAPSNTDTNIRCKSEWLINSQLEFQYITICDHIDTLAWTNVLVERSRWLTVYEFQFSLHIYHNTRTHTNVWHKLITLHDHTQTLRSRSLPGKTKGLSCHPHRHLCFLGYSPLLELVLRFDSHAGPWVSLRGVNSCDNHHTNNNHNKPHIPITQHICTVQSTCYISHHITTIGF